MRSPFGQCLPTTVIGATEKTQKSSRGNLNLTYRQGLLTGGGRGAALVPGQADESLIIEAIGYGNEDLQMPPKAKLPEEAIANLRKWIAMGAADPLTEKK